MTSRSSPRLLLDAMLGKLSTYLRMCGYDAAYALDRSVEDDDAVLALAREEGRTLLTRDAALATRAGDALLLESKEVTDQLRELRAAGWTLSLDDPSRCSACNGALERVESGETPEHAPDVDERRVWRCRNCGQHFWKGSHWESVEETLSEL
ncbi:hypothetical protein DMJ13_08900 [halophilic archaeon]|nr:hypothetical protein DMJ13_08900 [halophilic archaeon]